ncbi:dynein regulatory complex protein 9-like [Lucilia cuprina]|uniref:dynein regulatory complex protein 9-like n=1 Tax=Lucilia cuprina TaxID=7375 RepID=UPI001F063299|nr:dynein regulatory complex protein 9-like [Lucilia cuprina]
MTESIEMEEFKMTAEDLKDFKRDLLATVYNQTHTQLMIYQQGKCLRTAKANKTRKSSHISTIADNEEPLPSADVLNDIKLDKELDALRNIYKVGFEELTKENIDETNPYSDLIKAIEVQKQNNNEVDILTKELKENKAILKHLKELQKKEQAEMTEQLSQKTQRIEVLRDQLNNIKRINHLEVRLVEKWENNRLTQATILGEKKERLLMKEILELNRRMAGEQRLIYEIESFRNHEISELKDKISEWEHKFQEEKSKIITKNLTLTQNIADIVKSHEKHREITEQRQIFVAEYLQQKAEEQRLYEQQRYRIECAVRIQAWWRGVMVRKGLGPYRKKSKKGKKSKSKK